MISISRPQHLFRISLLMFCLNCQFLCFWNKTELLSAQLTSPANDSITTTTNTMLMPGLHCSPNDPVRINFANFCKFSVFFNRQALGYFGLVLRYHFRWKLQENLATLIIDLHVLLLLLPTSLRDETAHIPVNVEMLEMKCLKRHQRKKYVRLHKKLFGY